MITSARSAALVLSTLFLLTSPVAWSQPEPPETPAGPEQPTTVPAAATAAEQQQLQRRVEALADEVRRLRQQQRDGRQAELERRVGVVTEELQRLKESLVLPEKEELKSHFGLGPAASKIYGAQRGLSFGGYGEFFFERQVDDAEEGKDFSTADFLRYIQYIGYKFTDRLLVNAEIEIEHASTGAKGEVSLEFAYLDYLAHPALNLRAGLLLVPMGFLNEMHEPPFYYGNLRPEVERTIIPSTWRELGAGIFGEPFAGLSYKVYVTNGLNGAKFGDSGWRSGRQKGSKALLEDIAVTVAVDYRWGSYLLAGASFFYGGADHDQFGDLDVTTFLGEAHLQLRYRGLQFRALGAVGALDQARGLTLALFPDSDDPQTPEQRLVASRVYGWYAELAYDVWPLLSQRPFSLAPYARFEQFNTQARVPDVGDRRANEARDRWIMEAGVSFKPHPQVVLKVNYRENGNDKDTAMPDSLYFGGGFVY